MAPMIQLDRGYRLTANRRNWILQRPGFDRQGHPGWESKNFFPRLDLALNHYCQEKLRLSNVKSFDSLKAAHRRLLAQIRLLVKGAGLDAFRK